MRAGSKRRREFATGRWLARTAMGQLGLTNLPLSVGEDRGPVWPPGIVGSISHTDDYCVAVVARNPPYRSLGIDAEPAVPLESSLWPRICTPAELAWLETQPAQQQGLLCHVLFTVKECVYKYQAPISHTFLEFHDVEVTLEPRSSTFRARVTRDNVPGFPQGTDLLGRTLDTPTLFLAGMC